MPEIEELIYCPYNSAHRIRPGAMPKHLFKCRRNYPSRKLVSCPFNTVHRVPTLELSLHIAECPDRATFELYKYCIADGSRQKAAEPELIYNDKPPRSLSPKLEYYNDEPINSVGKSLQDDDECWDDSDVPAYNPEAYCRNANVIRKATLMKKSDKRDFYQAERERLYSWRSSASSESDDSHKRVDSVPQSTATGADEWWDDDVVPAYNGIQSKLLETKEEKQQFTGYTNRSDWKQSTVDDEWDSISASLAQTLKMNYK